MILINRIVQPRKDISKIIRVTIPSGGASLNPPIGPMLAQLGINVNDFANTFNAYTLDNTMYDEEMNIRTMVVLYVDKSYDFYILYPPVSFLVSEMYVEAQDADVAPRRVRLLSLCMLLSFQKSFLKRNPSSLLRSLLGTFLSIGVKVVLPKNIRLSKFFKKSKLRRRKKYV